MPRPTLTTLFLVCYICKHATFAANRVIQGYPFPTYIPTSGVFDVPVAYSSSGDNTLVVDIMMENDPYTWYGGGVTAVHSGVGNITVTCTFTTAPPAGSGTMLKIWLVSTSRYELDPPSAFYQALVAVQYPLKVVPGGGIYDFVDLLNKTIMFFDAQRSGVLPADNRISWRGDSAVDDQGSNGESLSGGWYDGGDGVKFNFPMAYSTTVLAWSLVEHREVYEKTGQLKYALANLKWTCDYFVKCHVSANVLYGQVGDGGGKWRGRPEDMSMTRNAYKIDTNAPGSDLAGETAAALAASSIVFRRTDSAYANTLVKQAKAIYAFADANRGSYSESIPGTETFYPSTGYLDELAWAAVWLYRATGEPIYLNAATTLYHENRLGFDNWSFSWDQKSPGLMALLYKLTKKSVYQTDFQTFMAGWMPGGSVPYTPKGIAWRSAWGSLRYAANTAFLALMDADYINATDFRRAQQYRNWALNQIRLMIGDSGRSYVVGFGYRPPTHCQHSGASCASVNNTIICEDPDSLNPNPNILYGALVGGPDAMDVYEDVRNDYQHNGVACDFNAGFTAAVARLANETSEVLNGGGFKSSATFSTISPLSFFALFILSLLNH